jgi:hypothetical protein
VYEAAITAFSLTAEDGTSLLDLCELLGRKIWSSSRVPPGERLNVLLHELQHAWQNHVPEPRDEEEAPNRQTLVTASAMRDLEQQGATEGLEAMRADPPAPVAEVRETYVVPDDDGPPRDELAELEERAAERGWGRASGERAACAVCGYIVADGSIHDSPPRWSEGARGLVIDRAIYCPGCDHVQKWTEGVTASGKPNGELVAGPSSERGGRSLDALLGGEGMAEAA